MKTIVTAVALSLVLGGAMGCKKKEGDKKSAKGSMTSAGAMDPGSMAPDKRATPQPDKRPAVVEEPKVPVDKEAVAEAVLSEVTGTVEVRRAGTEEFKAAAKDTKVFAKDAVRVGNDGEATLALWDNSSVELTPETAVTLNGSTDVSTGSPSVTVMSGAARFDVNERTEGQPPFNVYTPSAAVAVQGTVLAVGVGLSGAARIAVEEGKVAVMPVAKVEVKASVALPAGKVLVVPYGKPPAPPAAYSANNAGWDSWLEAEDKKGVQQGAVIAKTHAEQVEALQNDADALERAEDQEDLGLQKLQAQAEAAAKAKKLAEYKKLQPQVEQRLVNQRAVLNQYRYVHGRALAHAYLLGLMSARMNAGVYKVKDPAVRAAVLKHYDRIALKEARWERRRLKRRIKRHRRAKRWHRAYYRHDPEGRIYARKHKIALPKYYQALKLRKKMRRRHAMIRGYKHPVYHRPMYRGKRRRAAMTRRNRAWYRNAKWQQLRKKRMVRAKVKRARWRKAVIQRRMKRWKKRPKYHKAWRARRRVWRKKNIARRFPHRRRFRGMRPGLRGMHPGLRGMRFGMRGMHPMPMGKHPGLRGRHPGLRGMGPLPMGHRGMRFGMRMGMGMHPMPMGMRRGRFGMRRHGMLTPMQRRKLRRKMRRKMRRTMGGM